MICNPSNGHFQTDRACLFSLAVLIPISAVWIAWWIFYDNALFNKYFRLFGELVSTVMVSTNTGCNSGRANCLDIKLYLTSNGLSSQINAHVYAFTQCTPKLCWRMYVKFQIFDDIFSHTHAGGAAGARNAIVYGTIHARYITSNKTR